MAAPIEHKYALLAILRAEFETACPDIPMCKQHVAEVFEEIKNGDTDDAFLAITMLAAKLNLDICVSVHNKKDALPTRAK